MWPVTVSYHLFRCLPNLLFALMMEAASTSETSLNFYQTTRRNIPEGSHLQPKTSVKTTGVSGSKIEPGICRIRSSRANLLTATVNGPTRTDGDSYDCIRTGRVPVISTGTTGDLYNECHGESTIMLTIQTYGLNT
jgi:hypothetical protein